MATPEPGSFAPYPAEPPNPQSQPGWFETGNAPKALRPVVVLLLINLGLSVLLTILTFAFHQTLIDYQLDHRHISDPRVRAALQSSYSSAVIIRAVGNIVVSVVYAFLVRALFRGRRWAYRRVILLAALGILGLLSLQAEPYPVWMRVEQVVQAVVLAAMLYFVFRPEVKAYFDPNLPGRTVRRFGR